MLIYSLVYSRSCYSSQDNNHSRCHFRHTQQPPIVTLRLPLNQYGAVVPCKKKPCHLPSGPTSSLFGNNHSQGNCKAKSIIVLFLRGHITKNLIFLYIHFTLNNKAVNVDWWVRQCPGPNVDCALVISYNRKDQSTLIEHSKSIKDTSNTVHITVIPPRIW